MFSHIRRAFLLCTLLAAGAVMAPAMGQAQGTRLSDHAVTDSTGNPASAIVADPAAGPRAIQAGVMTRDLVPAPLFPQQSRERHVGVGSNLALMGVGLAALIIGLSIGDDAGTVVAISGATLGLIGLYRYLR